MKASEIMNEIANLLVEERALIAVSLLQSLNASNLKLSWRG